MSEDGNIGYAVHGSNKQSKRRRGQKQNQFPANCQLSLKMKNKKKYKKLPWPSKKVNVEIWQEMGIW